MPVYRVILFCLFILFVSNSVSQDNTKNVRIEPDYTWKADPEHSYISFRTKHWGIVEITGWFEKYEVTLNKEGDDWATSKINIDIDPKSVRMPNMEMARNLQGAGLFDSDNFPKIIFNSTGVEQLSDSNYVVTGELTIKESSKSISWDVVFNGSTHPPYGTPGFTATGQFLLSDFGLNDMQVSPSNGQLVLGDSVFVRCSFRLEAEWD